jgi:peptidyl-prolyl cis-trans isomerase C
MTRGWFGKAIREPLVHFLVAGAALFLIMGQYGSEDVGDRNITIDETKVAGLAKQWEETWRRPPSPQELDGLIRDHIKEEIYFREAIRLGLDSDDPIIRRRLRSKMEFLATAEAENTPPTDAELERFYAANKSRYAANAAYSFEQRYYGEDEVKAREATTAIAAGKSPSAMPISLPTAMKHANASDIAKQFGDGFAAGLAAVPTGAWAGPVQSGYGWHAVRVNDVTASKIPPLSEIRQSVANDWRAQTRAAREAAAYQALLDGYGVSIARP